jgi:hypothetical protein
MRVMAPRTLTAPADPARTAPRPGRVLEAQIFADASGRRTRLLRVLALALAALVALWVSAVVAGLFGLGTLPGVPEFRAESGQGRARTPAADPPSGATAPGVDRGGAAAERRTRARRGTSPSRAAPVRPDGPARPAPSPRGQVPRRARPQAAPPPARATPQSPPRANPTPGPPTDRPGPPARPEPQRPGLTERPSRPTRPTPQGQGKGPGTSP